MSEKKYLSGEERRLIALRNLKKAQGKQTGPKTKEAKAWTRLNGWKHGKYSSSIVGPCTKSCPEKDTCPYLKKKGGKFGGPCQKQLEEFNVIITALEDAFNTNNFQMFKDYASILITKYSMVAHKIFDKILIQGLSDRPGSQKNDDNDKKNNKVDSFVEQTKINYDKIMLSEGRQYLEKLPKITKEISELKGNEEKEKEDINFDDNILELVGNAILENKDTEK